jgi:hypothetical protein
LAIGIAFGFGAGFLFTIGIISLINANGFNESQAPVGNSGASSNVTPVTPVTPTLAPTDTPTPTPTPMPSPTPSPIPATPIPLPTSTPALNNGSAVLFKPDDPAFYVIVFITFLLLSGFLLLRQGGGKK